jgi:hypothetical protein
MYRSVINGVPQWEVLSARRPMRGSDLTYRSPDRPASAATPDAGTISTPYGLYSVNAGAVQLASGRQPGPPSNDMWLGIEMSEAIGRGLARDLHESRTVAGRMCAVFRVADPPSGALHRLDESVGHDDLCLTDDGLVLSETWTYHGAVVQQRRAVTVSVDARWPASVPRPPTTTGARPASAAGAIVRPDPHPVSVLATPSRPTGFQPYAGPVSFRLPDPQHPTLTIASTVVWTFVHGAHVVTIEAGTESGGQLPWSPGDTVTRPARLRGLGKASTALRSDGPEVRVDLHNGQWVRVRGTEPLRFLLDYASTLTLN